ncbi:PREDICTED: putative olfactory receptor 10AC1-like [Lipotes vexillifer]|uniref:Olfactory receptor 10AC1-like n=1 Tax=Lipotes vexillifer TaxID=118797 RepID=A0A340Y091_LIPVE|nr:PREDICTED: putative olfactory receptor 10AC1-like [Lipotes vexillifer]
MGRGDGNGPINPPPSLQPYSLLPSKFHPALSSPAAPEERSPQRLPSRISFPQVPLGSQCADSARNATMPCGFLPQGFAEFPHLGPMLFLLLLPVHLATLSGNLLILVAVASVPSLPPMLLFLHQLSAIELCYMLAVVPRSLAQLASPGRGRGSPISFLGCAVQMQMFVALGGAECFLLAALAYDRYVAICHPRRYAAVVTPGLCTRLALACCCLRGLAVSVGLMVAVFNLPFCGSHLLVHFFSDITALLHLACTQSYAEELRLLGACLVLLLRPSLLILAFHGAIAAALSRLRSPRGRRKTASTCASHLAVTFLHYGCSTFTYVWPKASYSPRQDRTLALVYTDVTPLFYPLIYSLCNGKITAATRWVLNPRAGSVWAMIVGRDQARGAALLPKVPPISRCLH